MALDTKRAEIRKLEEQAAQREEALKKSEARHARKHPAHAWAHARTDGRRCWMKTQ